MSFLAIRIKSFKSKGLSEDTVIVEALKSRGLQQLQLSGLPDAWLRDVREKIKTLVSLRARWGSLDKVLIHLMPAGVEKCGAHLELPIVLACLAALAENLSEKSLELLNSKYFVGALNLQGELIETPETQSWQQQNNENLIGPQDYDSLDELWSDILNGELKTHSQANPPSIENSLDSPLWKIERRQEEMTWLYLSFLCELPVLVLGPPGIGKTYLAQWASQLPFFKSQEEFYLSQKIYSLSDLPFNSEPPLISPHPRTHLSEFLGVQRRGQSKPGYFSLAHNGTLILDEFCEFSRDCREILRNILDEKTYLQNTKSGTLRWPANFFLILTSNPCPCGQSRVGDLSKCRCPYSVLRNYQNHISGPLFDRMGVRIFLDHDKAPSPLSPQRKISEYLFLPESKREIRETALKVRSQMKEIYSQSYEKIKNHFYFQNFSEREKKNKAYFLSAIKILSPLSFEEILSFLVRQSQKEYSQIFHQGSQQLC